MSVVRTLACLAGLALLGACGGPPPPTLVQLTLQAGPDINPAATGEARPVVVRIYRLGGLGAFLESDFFSLEADAAGTLGRDLVGEEALSVAPGSVQRLEREFEPEARHLGIVAAFREIDRASWRAHAPVPPNQTTRLVALIEGDQVIVQGGP